jgi:nitrogen regulatory protein P-II 2
MKLILAIIKPQYLDAVKEELKANEIRRLTVVEVTGFGEQMGHQEVYRGQEFPVNLTPKLQLEIACNDEFVEKTITAICKAAKTSPEGAVGDGKIFVLDLQEAVKVRTGERGSAAI